MKRSRLRILLTVAGALALLFVAGLAWLMFAMRHVPHFYADALAVAPETQKKSSDDMLRRSATLSNNVRHEGRWQASFSTDEINGWLAVDLHDNHARALPSQLHEPRIAIHQGEIVIGCGYDQPPVRTVLSLTAEAYMQQPNVLALRIRRARAGAIPVPLKDVVKQLVRAGEGLGCRITLREVGSDPLLLLSIPTADDDGRQRLVHVDTVELREGELFVAGTTERADYATARAR